MSSPVLSSPVTFGLHRRATVDPAARPELDEAQRSVVDHRGGPLLVLAGPGTGKTTTLVETVVDRVHTDGLDPGRVLVLTFSRRAAAELRDRITARLDRTVVEPVARTFHSYAFGLLRREAVLRGAPAPRLLSGAEQDLMIRELLRGDVEDFGSADWPRRLYEALGTRGFAEELRDLLLRAAERGIGPGRLQAFGRRHGREDWLAAAGFAAQYAAVTALRGDAPAYDPAELVRAAADLLAGSPELLAAERADRALVCVDEYQDADPAQEDLLGLLAGDGRELIAVGDPDQSIYGFRGSDVEVIRRFSERFRAADGSEARVLALRTCRRSGRDLLRASRRVTVRLGGPPAHRRLVPAPGLPPGEVEVHLFRTHNQEAAYLAHRLRQAHLVEGVPWSRMAVVVRAGNQLSVLRRSLMSAGVPLTVRSEEIPLVDQPAVRPLLAVLQLATGHAMLTPELAVDLLNCCYGGADPLGMRRLRLAMRARELAGGGDRGSEELLRELLVRLTDDPESAEFDELDPAAAEPPRRITAMLSAAREAVAANESTAETVLWATWSAAGCSDDWARIAVGGGPGSAAADRDLDAVTALFDTVARFVDRMPAAGPAVFAEHLLGQEIPADTLAPRAPEGDAVTLLTAHASKGLEWDVVAVAGVQDGVWPDLRLRGTLLGSETLVDVAADRETSPVAVISRLLAEERRLFYVAVTRARRRLLVSAVSAEEDQPSRFLDELDPDLGRPEDGTGASGRTPRADRSGRGKPAPAEPPGERGFTVVPRGLDLASLVAELRAAVCAADVAPERRRAAARQLARLAAAGVRGAHPAQWYALPPLSDHAPLRAEGEPVRVSPSKVEAYETCALRWLLESSGGTRADELSQSVGNLVHDLAYDVARGELPADDLVAAFEERWPSAVDSGTGWSARKAEERARDMVVRLRDWLKTNPRELVGAERAFAVELGRARLAGRVDRLERDADGRLVVVDLKTGRNPPTQRDVDENVQLGAYQSAVEHGGFGSDSESGGAMLVQLGKDRRGGPEQRQPPLADAPDPKWSERVVAEAAEGMAGSEFTATENRFCRVCAVKSACPLHVDGGQVTP